MLALAGVRRGDAFTGETIEFVRRRLDATGRFEGVQVLRRFASIADPTQIALVIIVDEHAVRVLPARTGEADADRPVRIVRRRALGSALILPLVGYEDGYGLAYGAVVAYPGVGGRRNRLAFPLTWGGSKRAAAEYDVPITTGPIGRIGAGVAIERRTNPAFDEEDSRNRLSIRADTPVRWFLRAGVTGLVERVTFADDREVWRSVAFDVTLDTRADPIFPRNALFASVQRTVLSGVASGMIARNRMDLQGFAGLGRPVVRLRLEHDTSDRVLPLYFKPLLGGWSSVRGFAAGSYTGDNRLVASLEVRVPVSSPLSVSRAGFSVFADGGKVYDAGELFRAAPWRTGAGAGVWVSAAVVKAGLSVARAQGGGTRVSVGVSMGY